MDDNPLPLPLDILLDIFARLPIQAILALRRTCRPLAAITRTRALWAVLFRTHVLDQRIPCPTGTDFESRTRRALVLRRIWTSPEPRPHRQRTFRIPSEHARVVFLQFLPGRSHRWLISVRMTARPQSYLLQCWDVATDPPRCVAELRHADGPYGGVVLNSDPDSTSVLAMQSAQTETFSIRFDVDPEHAFETVAAVDGIRELHLLTGSTLVTRSLDDGALSLWDLTDLRHEKVQLLNPSLAQADPRLRSASAPVHAVHIAHDYALVVRVQSIEIYSTTPRPSLLSPHGPPIAYPLAQFRFQWRTDTVILSEQHLPPSPRPALPPIHLLVRYESIYPWPVNVLHHYLLLPNPTYHTGGRHAHALIPTPGSTPSSSPISPSSPNSFSPRTTEYNLPYDPRPYPTHVLGSPIRLFGQSAMTLGRYGTALWLDNHTEEWLGPSERGQRLAGRVFRFGDAELSMMRAENAGGVATPALPAEPTVAAHSSDASTVFGIRDDDAWTRIAMDEEAGRIALGHTDGAITLFEY